MKTIKRFFIFIGTFLLYHIIFSSFFTVDEHNVLQAPDWYVYLGFGISATVALFFTDPKKFHRSKRPMDTSYTKNKSDAETKIPASRKKQSEMASDILSNIEMCVDLANQSTRVSLFVEWYDEAATGLETLMKLEKVTFRSSPALDYYKLKDEFQWHLCDAIVRAKEKTLSDIKNKYKNSREFQARSAGSFEEDLASVQSRFSEATAELARNANEEVKIAAKLDTPKLHSTALPITTDEFSRYGGTDAALLSIDLMEGHEFEHWCAEALRNSGFADVEVTPGSGDQGVDVLAKKDGIKYAVQCKCYSTNLGNTPIQEVNAGKFFYRAHVGVVMTNQHFTPKARELAEATGTLLWDRDWIKTYLDAYPAGANSTAQTAPVDHISAQNSSDGEAIKDEMFPACVDVILETGQASVAMIQRRLKLQYARAAQLMDLMEKFGIVGPYQGSRPRNILITKEQWSEMRPNIQNLK